MPKNKKEESDSGSESEQEMKNKKSKKDHKKKNSDTSDSDSGPEDKTPAKKSKPEVKKAKSKDSSEENQWSLGKNRFVKLTEFKNNWYLDVREFYNADGDLKPSKKGIMLTMEQWQKLKNHMEDIDKAIRQNV
ncbi:unnamed protein product [Acanthoscelides obtectus]|uniref:Transcriptional coactivator p15 (PC4) C-terminal domain-containing protein n=1 Tax=Acanthoscelides obtectus TaxID=200917 RepID=A0A9P0LJR5_ACAOB|nr:unnamed protein product [Acanthoscelides obtectus]CAK1634911.1 RNA polymerase II transcriptional coactivator KIWI [Acanthoscelides obtectus]